MPGRPYQVGLEVPCGWLDCGRPRSEHGGTKRWGACPGAWNLNGRTRFSVPDEIRRQMRPPAEPRPRLAGPSRLRQLLAKTIVFTMHHPGCPARMGRRDCTCGLSPLLTEIHAQGVR